MTPSISSNAPSQVTPEQPATILNQAQLAAEFGGDSTAQLAAMVFLFAREQRKNSAEQRNKIEGQISELQNAQVQKMHDSADAAYNAAVWQAGGQIVAGGLGAVGGAAKAGGSAWGEVISATGGLLKGGAEFAAAPHKLKADNREADAKHAGNQAASLERSLESVNSNAEDAKATKDAVYDFLQGVQDTKAESDKALVSIRA